jgi:D-aminoacyl-tRNA deacylase
MAYLVCSTSDITSLNIANAVKQMVDFDESEPVGKYRHLTSDRFDMLEVDARLTETDFLDALIKTDLFVFLSRHSSATGTASFTTHAEGNWSYSAELGGKPKMLSVASPINMMAVLRAINRANATDMSVTYEATHHGPLLDTPSLFVEIGGNEETLKSANLAGTVARSVVAMTSDEYRGYGKIAIGIGGTHYPEKFTKLALEGRYAFAHMMPRYAIENVDMLQKAVERSDSEVELAVIEWKSIKAADRDKIVKRLEELGLDYERV